MEDFKFEEAFKFAREFSLDIVSIAESVTQEPLHAVASLYVMNLMRVQAPLTTLPMLFGLSTKTESPEANIRNFVQCLSLRQVRDWLTEGVEATLQGATVGMWTAFEALAGDLWERCLNARPMLGFVAMDAEPLPGDDDDAMERKRKAKIRLPMWLLQKLDFNLKHHMGTVLRQTGKWDFANRRGAADAYKKVFKEDWHSGLKDIFENKQLTWLAAMRNVIVHNGARADEEFIKLVSEHHELSKIQENQRIHLDGALCRDLVKAGNACGTRLLGFADQWLTRTA